jgi:hypothetical protein
MCVGGRPKPPALPEPEPVDSAIEETADKVVIGSKRKGSSRQRKTVSSQTGRRRLGTSSLQIPLLVNTASSGNLNYS